MQDPGQSVPDHLASSVYRARLKSYLESFAARTPVRSVVVVGNAPLGASRDRADLIDSADLVFRCNSLVLDEPGDEPCLGRATHVVVLARGARPTRWLFEGYRSRAYLVVDVGSTRRPVPYSTPVTWPADLGSWPISNREFGIPLKIAVEPRKLGLGAVPTTGTLMAHVAHELFADAELYLTGFSFLEEREQTHWVHHYGRVVPVHRTHKIDQEGAILQSWVDEGSATFVA